MTDIKTLAFISRVTALAGRTLDTYEIEDFLDHMPTRTVEVVKEVPARPVLAMPSLEAMEHANTLLASVRKGEKVNAIKAYRSLTGSGLKEAKDAVETHAYGVTPYTYYDR